MKKQFIFILCGLFLCAGTIAATDYNVLQQGAVGDGKTLNTKSLQSAIDALHAKGGGQLYFPAGRYLTGSLQLKSNVTLYLEKEAVLLGSTSPYDYPGFSTEKELKVNNDHFDQALIYAEGAENIGDDLTGNDGNTSSTTDHTTDDTNDTDSGANTETRTSETKSTER